MMNSSCLFFIIISGLQAVITHAQPRPLLLQYIENEFRNRYSGVVSVRWPALDRMSRRDMGKLCVRIYRKHTLTDLGDFKTPTTAAMASYMGQNIKYQTVNARPQWIQVLRCGLDQMKFTKYRGPRPEPFLTFGGLDDDQAYILEERLDGYVYFVTKVTGVKERKRKNYFKGRSATAKRFGYSTSTTNVDDTIHLPDEVKIYEMYERMESEQRKNSTEEYDGNEVGTTLSLAQPTA